MEQNLYQDLSPLTTENFHFKRKKLRYITIEKAKEVIAYMYQICYKIYRNYPAPDEHISTNGYIIQKEMQVELIYRVASVTYNWIFYLDDRGEDELPALNPMTVASTINRYYKIPRYENVEQYTAEVFTYANPKYKKTWFENCICYDRNRSYAYEMTQPFPDTTVEPHSGIIQENEIGFNVRDNYLELMSTGYYATIIFPSMPSPFIKFVKKYTKKTDDKEKNRYNKQMINIATGWLSRWNIFWRAVVVNRARLCILDLMDENTLYCNTDSIVSLKERNDIPLSDKIGDFKIEKQGDFAYLGTGAYQWHINDKYSISYKGVSKRLFPDKFDIVRDGMAQVRKNIYYIDYEKGTIEKW